MIGVDQAGMLTRLKALLPDGWFPDSSPVLDALLSGFAYTLSLIYSLIQYVQLQTRIATATGGNLDLISYDYFGTALPRRAQETDTAFRARIRATLFQEKVTRPAMVKAMINLTGRTPWIFEPWRPLDTGSYGIPTSGYGLAGGYGSELLPAQFFMVVFRQEQSGIPFVAGYGSSPSGYHVASRGEWASVSQIEGAVTDADIMAAIAATKAEGTTAWVQLSS